MDTVTDGAVLEGALDCPGNTTDPVIFAHDSGSSRFSPRSRYVTDQPHAAGLDTLLFDLLSIEEAPYALCRFDIALLVCRLQRAAHVVSNVARERSLRLGYFGVSAGAAAAILVASELGDTCAIEAVVSHDGHPDLADQRALTRLACPTPLIASAADLDILNLNRQTLSQMHCKEVLGTIPRVTHSFEEAGALEQVAEFTWVWFVRHLSAAAQSRQHTR